MNISRLPLWQKAAVALLTALVIAVGWRYYHVSHRIVWTMVHVSGDRYSGDAHLLELPGGQVILIDTGFDRFTRSHLIPYIEKRGIKRLDQVVITHAHRNHYGGVGSLIKALDGVQEVYFNLPPEVPCNKENWPTGCNYAHAARMRQWIADAGSDLRSLHTDDIVYHDDKRDITLKVVHVHDGTSKPIGNTGINDTSAVMRLDYGGTSVLFSGDINHRVGAYLVDNEPSLKADILTAPHHGVESAASNEFLEAVGPDVLMVSNSAHHWRGERGERMRRYAQDHDIPVYVTGIHGNVVVMLMPGDFTIDTQLDPSGR